MLSLSDPAARPRTPIERAADGRYWLLYWIWILACALGGTIGYDRPVGHMEPGLRHLLVLMALLKSAMAIAAAFLVQLRMESEIRAPMTLGYVSAVALMCVAQAMMWHPVHLVAAGILFHAGLLLFLGLAYADRDAGPPMLGTWKARVAAAKRGYL